MKLRWENKNSLGNRLRMNRVKFPYVGGQFGDGSYVKYAYDKTSQLLSERMFLANDTEFLKQEVPASGGYDDAGNRLQYNITDHGIEKQIASAYDEANQLNARNVRFHSIPNQSWQTTYTSDLRGNRTQKVQPAGAGLEAEQWDYTFNIFNKLTKVEKTKLGVKTEVGFKYGADGYRVEKRVEHASLLVQTNFIMDGVHVILEKDAESETVARYIPGVCMITRDYNNQPVIRYYHQDALGSFVAMTDEDQNITALYQSDAWGNELLATEDVPNPYRWNGASGYYRDNDVQMYLLGMRWYDAETGRFVSRDPIGFAGGDVNLNRYVANNPVVLVDPKGLLSPLQWGCCIIWAGLGAWEFVEKVSDGVCYGRQGKELLVCLVGQLLVAALPAGEGAISFLACAGEALLKQSSRARIDGIIDCFKSQGISALRDGIKIAAAICCFPPILQHIRGRLSRPILRVAVPAF